jgi:hypothetical protein
MRMKIVCVLSNGIEFRFFRVKLFFLIYVTCTSVALLGEIFIRLYFAKY